MIQQKFYLLTAAISICTLTGMSHGQTFSTVVDVPPDVISQFQVFDSDTQINIFDGATTPDFSVGRDDGTSANVELNVFGGNVSNISVFSGATANISGGEINAINLNEGATVFITGGIFSNANSSFSDISRNSANPATAVVSGGLFDSGIAAGSGVTFLGNEFMLNGVAFNQTSLSLSSSSDPTGVLTGTLADGTPFISAVQHRGIWDNVTITQTAISPADTPPFVVDNPASVIPNGLRAGQVLTLRDGGAIVNPLIAVGATLNIEGGSVSGGIDVADTIVNISGGSILGNNLPTNEIYARSTVNLTGGQIFGNVRVWDDAQVNLIDGFSSSVFTELGGHVAMSGGSNLRLDIDPGASAEISGGVIGRTFQAFSGSDVEFVGGEYKLNGVVIGAGRITLNDGDVLTGTLADGSTFTRLNIDDRLRDTMDNVLLTEVALPSIPAAPILINGIKQAPEGLRQGQSATLVDGGQLSRFFSAVDATMQLDGGSVGERLTISGSTVTVTADVGFQVSSTLRYVVLDGGILTHEGGQVQSTNVYDGGELNILGGELIDGVQILAGGELNFVGTNFAIDGVLIEDLIINTPITIFERDAVLTGALSNGSPFSYSLNSIRNNFTADFVDSNATLTVTLIPEPSLLATVLIGASGLILRRR